MFKTNYPIDIIINPTITDNCMHAFVASIQQMLVCVNE